VLCQILSVVISKLRFGVFSSFKESICCTFKRLIGGSPGASLAHYVQAAVGISVSSGIFNVIVPVLFCEVPVLGILVFSKSFRTVPDYSRRLGSPKYFCPAQT